MTLHFLTLLFHTLYSLKEKEIRYPLITDGYFLKNNPGELFHQHKLVTVPFMTGVNNDEGGFLLAQVGIKDLTALHISAQDIDSMLDLSSCSTLLLQTGQRGWTRSISWACCPCSILM